jgi:hypothetical protein
MAYRQHSKTWKRVTKKSILHASDSVLQEELSKKVRRGLGVRISILICARHQTRSRKRKRFSGLSDFDVSLPDGL